MVLLSSLIAALPLSPGAQGSPVDSKRDSVVKRDATEVIYLAALTIPPPSVPYWLGYVAYYPTTALGLSGAEPSANDEAIGPWGGNALWHTWPTPCSGGNTHYEILFPSGVNFQFDLNYGAANAAVGAVVGGGWNGFHAFSCVKDSGRVMWTVSTENPGADVVSLINCTRV